MPPPVFLLLTDRIPMALLPFPELEDLYDRLAEALDACGPERESVFLAKLVLRMAHEMGDGERMRALIAECLREPASPADGTRLV